MDIPDRVTAYIEKHHLFPGSGEIIVAVSGGADSLCLLHLLNRLCGPGKRYPQLRLHAAHLNHMLRGAASEQDAETVAKIAADWGIPCTVGTVDVPALAREEHRSLEDAARVARYRFLRQVAQGQPIAVAHHADDQVETLLLHWIRGSGLAGLVGMLPKQQDIIRPLLAESHAESITYCRQHAIVPLEDLSNTDPRFLRNRIRHELLPLLESLNPGIQETLLRNADSVRVDVEWIETQVDACWLTIVLAQQENSIKLDARTFLALPLSLYRHLLRRVTARLYDGQSPLEARHYRLLEQLLAHKNDGQERRLDFPRGLRVIYDFNHVTFKRLNIHTAIHPMGGKSDTREAALLSVPGCVEVVGTSWQIAAEMVPEDVMQQVRQALQREDWPQVWRLLPSTRHTVYADADKVGPSVWVRTRLPGDRMRPLGMIHEKKVQDILVDKHIARHERDFIPLVFSPSHCIWLAGVCLDDRVKISRETQRIVRFLMKQV
ncbi:MAG TPA: tRNA lysidine(34) synthetase TilS [Ktedonobacteraceae bacterium]|nr:tRNA lysidine(34) synthetase TilS [Ktedonobacteraceae bacterium]